MSPSNSRTPSPKTQYSSHDFSFSMRGLNSAIKKGGDFSADADSNKYEQP